MARSSLVAAALLAVSLVGLSSLASPAAFAFEFDAQGSSNADGSPQFTDPDEKLGLGDTKVEQKFDPMTGSNTTTNTMMIAPGLFLSGSASANSSNNSGDSLEWQNPKPGRLTR